MNCENCGWDGTTQINVKAVEGQMGEWVPYKQYDEAAVEAESPKVMFGAGNETGNDELHGMVVILVKNFQ